MSNSPIDDDGNYVQPVTLAGPRAFTGVSTATTAEQAEAAAMENARNQAWATYGPTTTQFVSFNEITLKFNPSENLNTTGTYTATVTTTAVKIADSSLSGQTETQTAQFLSENNALPAPVILSANAPAEPSTVVEPTPDYPTTFTSPVYSETINPVTIPGNTAQLGAGGATEGARVNSPPVVPTTAFNPVVQPSEQQRQIIINTSGLPVIAEDGVGVAQGVLRNPETGEIFYTGAPAVNAEPSAAPLGESEGSLQGFSSYNGQSFTIIGQAPPAEVIRKSVDWRFKISLSSSANYLYGDPEAISKNHILNPLRSTGGVIFPYTPQISLTYSANYNPTELTHSNYKIYNYTGSSVDNITITGIFTAQDTVEANYMLAMMHFFKSVTKMFYGRDSSPTRGTPPPLCYLSGHGTYAFDNHPVAVSSFSLNYPDDVDYINAGPEIGGTSGLAVNTRSSRLTAANLNPGGTGPTPRFSQTTALINTRVPTKLQVTLTCLPMVSRYDISNNFSLKDYASGKLMRASANNTGRGMW